MLQHIQVACIVSDVRRIDFVLKITEKLCRKIDATFIGMGITAAKPWIDFREIQRTIDIKQITIQRTDQSGMFKHLFDQFEHIFPDDRSTFIGLSGSHRQFLLDEDGRDLTGNQIDVSIHPELLTD